MLVMRLGRGYGISTGLILKSGDGHHGRIERSDIGITGSI